MQLATARSAYVAFPRFSPACIADLMLCGTVTHEVAGFLAYPTNVALLRFLPFRAFIDEMLYVTIL